MTKACPGQDTRYWGPDSIYDVRCPSCSGEIEFFKNDPTRKCKECGEKFWNPKLDLGCLEWCKYADKCTELMREENGDNQ
jgi:hypothetical protein